ncbi:hypothetical protein ACFSM7_09630 [Clavibacter michiganensis subsp. tessellarius]
MITSHRAGPHSALRPPANRPRTDALSSADPPHDEGPVTAR